MRRLLLQSRPEIAKFVDSSTSRVSRLHPRALDRSHGSTRHLSISMPFAQSQRVLFLLGCLAIATLATLWTSPASAQTSPLQLRGGMNHIAYLGPTLPVDDALGAIGPSVSAIWDLDPVDGSWRLWAPALPDALLGFDRLVYGTPYFLIMREPARWEYQASSSYGTLGSAGADGIDGDPGPMGPMGPTGADGSDGVLRPPGPVGLTGLAGTDGADGSPGATGPVGLMGLAGPPGPIGLTGLMGPAGTDGTNGTPGAIGPAGPAGVDGADGTNGAPGVTGPAGADGTNGAPGSTGPAGPTGPIGLAGPPGPIGPMGLLGLTGADGTDGAPGGPAGPVGPTGPPGPTGAAGPAGPAGTSTMLIGGGTGDKKLEKNNATRYVALFGATTFLMPADAKQVMPLAGTLSNFYVRIGAAQPYTFTVFKNDDATSITCATGAADSCSDVGNTVVFAAGDTIAIRAVATASGEKVRMLWTAIYSSS